MIDKKYGFILNQTIDFEVQKEIIMRMQTLGLEHPLIHGKDQPSCMKIFHVRTFDPTDSACWQKDVFINGIDEHDMDDYIYVNRCNHNINWYWADSPITDLVKKEVEKVAHLYEYICRVTVLVTDIGLTVPFHKEWMYGNQYQELYPNLHIESTKYFQNKQLIAGPYEDNINTSIHKDQEYLACKIPLTSIENNNGNSVFNMPDGSIIKYGAKNHLFCINEIEMKHGVQPTDFLRGVVYIDGKIKLDALKNEFYAQFKEL